MLLLIILLYLYHSKKECIEAAIQSYDMATKFIKRNYKILLVPVAGTLIMIQVFIIFDYFYDKTVQESDYYS